MSVETNQKSTSVLSKAVRSIRKNLRARNFIAVQKKKIQEKFEEPKDGSKKRGTVLLSHIPPGFYEPQMKGYFTQFGHVTNVKLARSEKSGRTKGFAYIEFRYPEVAKVVADTMNNYLLFNRLLKAKYLEKRFNPEFWKQKCSKHNHPAKRSRVQNAKCVNKTLTGDEEKKRVNQRLKKLNSILYKLKARGVDYSYKPALRKDVSEESGKEHQKTAEGSNKSFDPDEPILEIDESDEEIVFTTPPNVIKRKLKAHSSVATPSSVKSVDEKKKKKGFRHKERKPKPDSTVSWTVVETGDKKRKKRQEGKK